MKKPLQLFFLEFVGYFIVTMNMKAVADTNYLLTFVTDIMIATIGFTSVRMVVQATTRSEQVAYVMGGAFGAQVALFLSRWILQA